MMHPYPDPPDAPWVLLARHLAAELSPAERLALRAWVQADPTHLQILTTVTRAWERAGEAATNPVLFSSADVEAAWQRFRPLMTAAARSPDKQPIPRPTPTPVRAVRPVLRRRGQLWPLVAGLMLVLAVGVLLIGNILLTSKEASVAYASGKSRRLIQLPDGSRAWLNRHSRLRYTGFGPQTPRGVRAVQLTGEAYFDVVHQPGHPFLVSTATARIRVVGTAFNVRAYAAEDSVEVSVRRGRVRVVRLTTPDSVLLPAGTRVAVRAVDAPGRIATALRQESAQGTNFRAWQTDTLRFQDASVAEVVRSLRATYGTVVQLTTPALGRCRFTGTFARPQPAQVLAVLAAATASHLTPDEHGGYRLEGLGCLPAGSVPTPTP